jgi:hypothetical protein
MYARLINDALFPLTTETRLIILMTAVKALWESLKRKSSIVALADALLAHLDALEGDEDDKADVAKRVANIRVESISRMCRDKIAACLLRGARQSSTSFTMPGAVLRTIEHVGPCCTPKATSRKSWPSMC